jgi:excisionase family DNA binding protein
MLNTYKDVLDVNDLCAVLRISRKTAYSLLKQGIIPYKKIGRVYRIRKTAVIEYLNK